MLCAQAAPPADEPTDNAEAADAAQAEEQADADAEVRGEGDRPAQRCFDLHLRSFRCVLCRSSRKDVTQVTLVAVMELVVVVVASSTHAMAAPTR